MRTQYYLGLMSGSSCDGVDIACIRIQYLDDKEQVTLVANQTYHYDEKLQAKLLQLSTTISYSIDQLAQINIQVSNFYASIINQFCSEFELTSIEAVGIHGHNIRHNPNANNGFSWQLGELTHIAHKVELNCIGNFRQSDIANGGQGAPLTPIFHQKMFASEKQNTIIINLGGICNITFLEGLDSAHAFDVGPANTLIDAIMREKENQTFDFDGHLASSGLVDNDLLDAWLNDVYFQLPPPKSTGNDLFNLNWLNFFLDSQNKNLSSKDLLRTLVELTAITIKNTIPQNTNWHKTYILGGGAHNSFLMERVNYHLHLINVNVSPLNPQFDKKLIDFFEAMTWAWLAYSYQSQISYDLSKITGSKNQKVLGVLASS